MAVTEAPIVILGGGPAGSAVAIGLRRLGYDVTLITEPRAFGAVEGVSERVLEGLKYAGFEQALATIPEPSSRLVTWNGSTNQANTERLIDRKQFDLALEYDLLSHGVRLVRGRVSGARHGTNRFDVSVTYPGGIRHSVMANFLVEARGRAAPLSGKARIRGPESVSLTQHWRSPEATPYSAVESFRDGWAWMAQRPGGKGYIQLTLDPANAGLPARSDLERWFVKRLKTLKHASRFIANITPASVVRGRASTQILCEKNAGNNWIRVGDAAMAVDPLSGNGIFQSLSSALQAPAVINTLIQHPERVASAKRFHERRIEGLFYRFARTGRDFYEMEHQWPESPFWLARRHWPDIAPLHQQVSPEKVHTALSPVIQDGLIRDERVVVTPDQPLGVWQLNGWELAPLLDAVRAHPGEPADKVLANKLNSEAGPVVAQWMRKQGWIQ